MALTYDGTAGITFNDGSQMGSAGSLGMRNRIINGGMVIAQRGNTASWNASTVATGSQYCVDRFRSSTGNGSWGSGASFAVTQSTVVPNSGFQNSLLFTANGTDTPAASSVYTVNQTIEGYNTTDLQWGTSNAQTCTLSFWVRSSLTGLFAGSIQNGNTRSYVYTYTINSANTWQYVTVTIPGDTGAYTWGTGNSQSIYVRWCLGAGSNFQTSSVNTWTQATNPYEGTPGQVNLVATNGATFYLTGVQFEKGTIATPFEYRPVGLELSLCQRYYQTIIPNEAGFYFTGYAGSSTTSYYPANFIVKMRAAPTVSNTGNVQLFSVNWQGSTTTGTAITFQYATTQSVMIGPFTSTSGLTTGQAVIFQNTGGPTIYAISEL